MRKLISAAFGAGLLMISATPAFAKTEVTYKDTGPLSTQRTRINRSFRVDVNNNQLGVVTNNVNSSSNSGGNLILGNTKVLDGGGTGSAKSKVDVYNDVNNSLTVVEGCGCDEDIEVTMDQTGPLSVNKVVINASQTYHVVNKQDAKVTNNINSSANSGGNMIIGNTKVEGLGSTGNARSNVVLDNYVNYSETWINATP